MSICNVVLTGRSVLIGVDTGAGYVDCVPQEHRRVSNGNSATKLWPLTSVNCLLAGRGQCSIVPAIAHMASAAIAAQGMAFDELCEALPDMLDEAVAVTRAHMLGSGLPGDMVAQLVDHGNEVSIAGWSMKLGRMAASSFWNCSDGKGVQRLDLGPDWPASIAPRFDHEDWERTPPRDATSMRAMVHTQMHEGRTAGLPPGTGGRLIVAELTRHRLVVDDLGEIVP